MYWPSEEKENMAKDEILGRKEFTKMFKKVDGSDVVGKVKVEDEDVEISVANAGNYSVMGQVFNNIEASQALDFYVMCECSGIFYLPRAELKEFLEYVNVKQNLGARLALALILSDDDVGFFLMGEEDSRIQEIVKKRVKNDKYGLDWDSPLILPN